MTTVPIEIKQAIANHAREVFPQEACGFVVNGKLIKCKNDHHYHHVTLQLQQGTM